MSEEFKSKVFIWLFIGAVVIFWLGYSLGSHDALDHTKTGLELVCGG